MRTGAGATMSRWASRGTAASAASAAGMEAGLGAKRPITRWSRSNASTMIASPWRPQRWKNSAFPAIVVTGAGLTRWRWQTVTASWLTMRSTSASLAAVAAVPREAQRDIVAPAPVLMVPYLLAPEQCRALIALHEADGNFDSGFAGVDAAGAPQYKIDYAKKKRRDHLIAADDPMHVELRDLLLRRCAPEIKRAFQVEINHIDRLLIGRYDDDGCFFRRHRDNAQASLAFRQFAISVNLNAEDYDGGELLFPEYNSHRYRPGTGTGLIFSASLLHEAAPVLRGSRYVLLSFLHSAEAETRRRARLASAAPSGAVSAGAAPL